MAHDFFELNGTQYAARVITLENNENVVVSTSDLNDALFDNQGQYISDQAQSIDEQIFFFVGNDEIDMPEVQLSKLVFREAFL
ncbi:MAG: hypothetical protein Pg6C_06190 [Treponemataceae bacterium]|nr:MAG: hypothetical protein Pg6C_06190 [Treponemataceae bacterium]